MDARSPMITDGRLWSPIASYLQHLEALEPVGFLELLRLKGFKSTPSMTYRSIDMKWWSDISTFHKLGEFDVIFMWNLLMKIAWWMFTLPQSPQLDGASAWLSTVVGSARNARVGTSQCNEEPTPCKPASPMLLATFPFWVKIIDSYFQEGAPWLRLYMTNLERLPDGLSLLVLLVEKFSEMSSPRRWICSCQLLCIAWRPSFHSFGKPSGLSFRRQAQRIPVRFNIVWGEHWSKDVKSN